MLSDTGHAVIEAGVTPGPFVNFSGHAGNESLSHKSHETIGVAAWHFDYVAEPLLMSAFILAAGLIKLGYHHAEFLSSKIPESCMLIVVGVIMGAIVRFVGLHEYLRLVPKTFFLVLLPPIVLEASYSIHDRVFANNLGTILLFAVVGTILNFFFIGPTMHGLAIAGAMGEIELGLTHALLYASFIVAVDPVAVLAIFQEVRVNNDLYFLVFGESLLNDAVTIVLYNTMLVLAEMENIEPGQIGIAIASFVTDSCGGFLIGVFVGMICSLITKKTSHVRVVEPLTVFVMAYLSYVLAELVHWSGIISLIGCGLVQAQYALENISNKSRITVMYFIKTLSAAFDALIFMFLGIELVSSNHQWHTGFVLWSLALCLIYRLIVTFALSWIANRSGRVHDISLREQFIMWYGGLRGAVCFALVATLPEDFHLKQIFLTSTLVVIMFTVFAQGITIKPLVNLFGIKKQTESEDAILTELNTKVSDQVMAGIEGITNLRGENYLREWFFRMNTKHFRRWFQAHSTSRNRKIMELYKELLLNDTALQNVRFYPVVEEPPPHMIIVDSVSYMHDEPIIHTEDNGFDIPSVEINVQEPSTENIKELFKDTEPYGWVQHRDRNLTREQQTDLFEQFRESHARNERLNRYKRRLSATSTGDISDHASRRQSAILDISPRKLRYSYAGYISHPVDKRGVVNRGFSRTVSQEGPIRHVSRAGSANTSRGPSRKVSTETSSRAPSRKVSAESPSRAYSRKGSQENPYIPLARVGTTEESPHRTYIRNVSHDHPTRAYSRHVSQEHPHRAYSRHVSQESPNIAYSRNVAQEHTNAAYSRSVSEEEEDPESYVTKL